MNLILNLKRPSDLDSVWLQTSTLSTESFFFFCNQEAVCPQFRNHRACLMSLSDVPIHWLPSQGQPTWLGPLCPLLVSATKPWPHWDPRLEASLYRGPWFTSSSNVFSLKENFVLPTQTLLTPDGQVYELDSLSQRDRRLLSTEISIRQYRRVVIPHLSLRLKDLRGKLPLRGDRKDQLLLQRKEEENYIGWIIMQRKRVRTK